MSKRKYTHMVQVKPIILKTKEAGMVHSEIAAELDLTTEQVKSYVWRYLKRKKRYRMAILQSRKDDLERMAKHRNKIYKKRSNGCVWKINCCGIFCSPQKGCEAKGQVRSYPSSPV